LPARRPLVYGIVGGALLLIVIAFTLHSLTSTAKESSLLSSGAVRENSTLPAGNTNTASETNVSTAPIRERSWLAVTRLDSISDSQSIANSNELNRGTFVAYNSDAPRTKISAEMFNKTPSLKNAFEGADGCRNGTEVCAVSYGVSEAGDSNYYNLSVSQEEAKAIREQIPLSSKTSDAILEFGDKLYWLVLHTTDEFRTPQMRTEFLEKVPIEPTLLGVGETLQYTVLVKTWATYGGPVETRLYAEPSSADSGISVRVEPNSLVLNERSEQKVKLIITQTENAKGGIYGIRIWGKFDNDQYFWPDNPCQHSACPSVKVGSSSSTAASWEIRSNAGLVGIGGKEPPKWLKLRLETNKEVYGPREKITFTTYLDNNSTDSSLVLNDARLIISIYPSNGSPTENVYNVDAWRRSGGSNDAGESLQPGSSIILAHPFEWDQRLLKDGIMTNNHVSAGRYTIDASFGFLSKGIVIYSEKEITIVGE
jgi:hypothetical protein